MLFVGLSIIAGIGLLILIIWALHKYQQKENVETVDRTVPLPPLELRESDEDDLSDPEEILGLNPSSVQESKIPASEQPSPSTTVQASDPTATAALDQWLEVSKEQQAVGDFTAALSTCSAALPQMGAFKQSCLILRAQIRTLKKAQQDSNAALEQLHHLAALASFFHSKATGVKPLSPSASKKVDYSEFAHMNTPYNDLGYEQLPLLSKTDIKWMIQAWGEPNTHTHMRQLHARQWQQLLSTLK